MNTHANTNVNPRRTSGLNPGRLLLALAATAVLTGCATTSAPVVYRTPSTTPEQIQRIDRDTLACRSEAERMVGLNARKPQDKAAPVARAGVIGFVAAAAAAAAGSASGVATKLLLDWNEPDEVHQEHVELCLKQRGHAVLGWR
jgi:hypothetical protein